MVGILHAHTLRLWVSSRKPDRILGSRPSKDEHCVPSRLTMKQLGLDLPIVCNHPTILWIVLCLMHYVAKSV